MYPNAYGFCTRAEQTLIKVGLMRLQWFIHIKYQYISNLQRADKQSVQVTDTLLLHDCVDQLCAWVWYGTSFTMTGPKLVRASFIYFYIHAIFSIEYELISWHSPPAAIIKQPNALVSSSMDQKVGMNQNQQLHQHLSSSRREHWIQHIQYKSCKQARQFKGCSVLRSIKRKHDSKTELLTPTSSLTLV